MRHYLVEKFVHRLLRNCRKNMKRYLFARWIAELIKDQQKTTDVVMTFARYFIQYNNGVSYEFEDVFVVGDTIYIDTMRPGYWIGKGGQNADTLIDMLNHNINGEKINNFSIRFIEHMDSNKHHITVAKMVY